MTDGHLTIESSDGVTLEGRWDGPNEPLLSLVFCHPHPQQRGTMNAPLMTKITQYLADRDVAVLRFNFRGVGRSTGTWDEGVGEVDDVAAAVAHAARRHPEVPQCLAGWSFGAATALRYQSKHGATMPYVGIAPPVATDSTPPLPTTPPPARRAFVIGDRDQFTTVEQLREYAESIDAKLIVINGSDHFFYFREDRVAEILLDELSGAV